LSLHSAVMVLGIVIVSTALISVFGTSGAPGRSHAET
jgi:hypothetical protein